MNELIAELRDSVESEKQEILAKLTHTQKDAVAKAEEFGWRIANMGQGMRSTQVRMISGGKTMYIDANGKRVQELRINNY